MLAETGSVVTVKVAEVAPPATVTVAGTVAKDELDPSLTEVPPAGAMPVKVTVPVDGVPPCTDVGERVTLDKVAGVIESVAFCELLP